MSKNCSHLKKHKGFSCMSLILDALNRAENERKNQHVVPDLNTSHSTREFNSGSGDRRNLWWILSGVFALVAIIAVLFLLFRPAALTQSTPEKEVATLQAVAPALKVEQKAAVTAVAKTAAPSQKVELTPAAVPVVDTPPKTTAPSAAVESLYASEDATPVTTVDSGVNELYAAEAATTASETIVDPFNGSNDIAVQSAEPVEQAPPRTYESITNIPDFNSLPWNMRQRVPTISYARHNFLAGGISSVVINNQTTGVGNIIGAGQFVVQEIYVDGVVLKHGDIVFKLRALTGWINM
jgi:general secretion pathway protein B